MAQVSIPQATISRVAARTIQLPQRICGTNKRISTRKASNVTSRVGSWSMRRTKRKGDECDGAWKWAARAMHKQMSVRKAAIG